MGYDQQIHGADRGSGPLQVGADGAVASGRLVVEGKDLQREEEFLESGGVFLGITALGDAIAQFRQGWSVADVREEAGEYTITIRKG